MHRISELIINYIRESDLASLDEILTHVSHKRIYDVNHRYDFISNYEENVYRETAERYLNNLVIEKVIIKDSSSLTFSLFGDKYPTLRSDYDKT